MPNQITLRAETFALTPTPTGGSVSITATVTDDQGKPLADINVSFLTGAPYAGLEPATGITDERGQAVVTLTYPIPNTSGHSGIGVIPVTADIGESSQTAWINFYDPRLKPIKIINTLLDEETGFTLLGRRAITFGVHTLIYFTDIIKEGDKVTFYWGDYSVRKTCVKDEHVWVISPGNEFHAEKSLKNGEYRVWYSIEDNAGKIIGAQPLDVLISESPYETASV